MACANWHLDFPSLHAIFGTARVNHVVLSGWEQHLFAVVAVDLILKRKIRRQSSRPGRIDATALVAKRKLSGRWISIIVAHLEKHFDAWMARKKHIGLIA